MFDEHVELLEAAGIEQKLDAFARRELAPAMLGRDAGFAAAGRGRARRASSSAMISFMDEQTVGRRKVRQVPRQAHQAKRHGSISRASRAARACGLGVRAPFLGLIVLVQARQRKGFARD